MKKLLLIVTIVFINFNVINAQWWPWGNEKKETQQKEQIAKKQKLEEQRKKQYERWKTYYKQAEAKARQFTEGIASNRIDSKQLFRNSKAV